MNDAWLAAVLNCRYRFCQRYNGSIFFLALLLLLLFFFLLLLFLSMLIFPIHLRLYGQVECRNLSRYRSPAAIGHCQLWRHRAGLLLFRWSSFLSHFYFIYFYFLHLFVSFLFVSCFVCFFVFFCFVFFLIDRNHLWLCLQFSYFFMDRVKISSRAITIQTFDVFPFHQKWLHDNRSFRIDQHSTNQFVGIYSWMVGPFRSRLSARMT